MLSCLFPQAGPEMRTMLPIRLSKSRLMNYLQCPKRLHLQTFRPALAHESASTQQAFSLGHSVGEVARQLVPGGLLIEHDEDLTKALAATQEALRSDPSRPLFEATFQNEGVLIRADVLAPSRRRHALTEVKASSELKPHYLHDCAIQAWVIEGTGLPLELIELAHVDTSFVYPGNGEYQGLLVHEEITDQVRPLIDQVPEWIDGARRVLSGPEPTIAPGDQCKDPYPCPFMDHCWPAESGYPVTLLPRDRKKQIATELKSQGINDIREIPEGRLANPRHEWIRRVTVAGGPDLDPAVVEVMRQYGYPRYYIDFETIQFAVPIWPGTRPYQMLTFQWSCHAELASGEVLHDEFLGPGPEAPMKEFAERLIQTLSRYGEGPVFAYNAPFERSRINDLATMFPALSDALRLIAERLVDLRPIAETYYYHPEMKGSWSLKAVLPTIAPELAYTGLGEVQDGAGAGAAYLEILDPRTEGEPRAMLVRDLREYCKRDTLALVTLARFFSQGSL
jgi:hypothetical protein